MLHRVILTIGAVIAFSTCRDGPLGHSAPTESLLVGVEQLMTADEQQYVLDVVHDEYLQDALRLLNDFELAERATKTLTEVISGVQARSRLATLNAVARALDAESPIVGDPYDVLTMSIFETALLHIDWSLRGQPFNGAHDTGSQVH